MAIYADTFPYNSTDAANTSKVLASKNIAGGAVPDRQSLRLSAIISTPNEAGVTATFSLKLGGVIVATFDGGSDATRADVEIIRDGMNTAKVVQGGFVESAFGLQWGAAQTLEIVGLSNGVGGAILHWAGLAK